MPAVHAGTKSQRKIKAASKRHSGSNSTVERTQTEGKVTMSHAHTTPKGTIDYDFHKKDADRLRREARNRFAGRAISFAVRAICFPFRQLRRLADAWQSAWPAPAARNEGTLHNRFPAKARSLFW
jgi:hypothetical protein